MRDMIFYRKIFGEHFTFSAKESKEDFVKIFDVPHIQQFESKILQNGGDLTVAEVVLKDNQKIAYYCDPDGFIFALLEHDG